jgi:probable HAF family extracellular repeat protein
MRPVLLALSAGAVLVATVVTGLRRTGAPRDGGRSAGLPAAVSAQDLAAPLADPWAVPGGHLLSIATAGTTPVERVFGDEGGLIVAPDPSVLRARSRVLSARFHPAPSYGGGIEPGPRRFRLELFDDVAFVGVAERFERSGPGRGLYQGRLENVEGGTFLLAYDGRAVAAAVDVPGRAAYQVRPVGGDRVAVTEVDPAVPLACEAGGGAGEAVGGRAMAPAEAAGARAVARVSAALDVTSPLAADHAPDGTAYGAFGQQGGSGAGLSVTTVDLMVVYTGAASGANGTNGTAGMNATIDLMVGRANAAFLNSRAGVRLRVVHRAQIAYTESGISSTDLTRLSTNGDGFMDSVHAQRTASGADLVTLIVNSLTDPNAGIANIFTGSSEAAFSVVKLSSHDSTFTHEAGHNFGCLHHRAGNSVTGPYGNSTGGGYSFGREFTPAGYPQLRTVMSTASAALRVPYFSNPDVAYLGVATGVPLDQAQPCHNALVIENTKAAVAGYRSTAGNQPPVVSIVSPGHDSEIAALANLTVNATATDSDGTVSRVDFYLLREDFDFGFSYPTNPFPAPVAFALDNAAPYLGNLTQAAAGFPTVVAAATDNGGGVGFATLALAVNPHYTVAALPLPAGFTSQLELRGINAAGRIVGFAESANGTVRACRWDGSTLTELFPLAGDVSSRVFAVDEAGIAYGQSESGNGTQRAVRWDAGSGNATNLSTTLIPGQTLVNLWGVDESSPTRRILTENGTGRRHRTETGNASILPLNANGEAMSVNGTATGYDYDFGAAAWRAFRWSSGSTSTLLAPVGGFVSSWGRAIAPGGAVVGWSAPDAFGYDPTTTRATFWSANSTAATDLGTLGRASSAAHGVNRFEDVVGFTANALPGGFYDPFAFVRRTGQPAADLARLVVPIADALFLSGDAINDSGVIAVTGFDSTTGAYRAYRATPQPGLSQDYWVRRAFTAAQIGNGTAADSADPDRDGLNNIGERAFGLNPLVPESGAARAALPALAHEASDGRLYLTFRRLRAPRDITYTVERSSSLASPSWTASGIEFVGADATDAGHETATYRTAAPAASPREFLRVRITRP